MLTEGSGMLRGAQAVEGAVAAALTIHCVRGETFEI